MAAKIRTLQIEEVANGFIVIVGCMRLVFAGRTLGERADFARQLSDYLLNPGGQEKCWLQNLDLNPEVATDYPEPSLSVDGPGYGARYGTGRGLTEKLILKAG